MNPYNIQTNDFTVQRPLMSLKLLYEAMPATTGCEKCSEVNGTDEFWCCKTTSPSMYYAEFLYVWREVCTSWNREKRLNLIMRAISNYLDNKTNKGCIFFDNGDIAVCWLLGQ